MHASSPDSLSDCTLVRLPELPLAALLRWQFVLLRDAAGELRIARTEAPDAALTAWLDAHLQETCCWLAAPADWVSSTLAGEAADYRALDEVSLAANAEAGPQDEGISLASLASEENPVVRLVNSTLHDAVADGASDIHFEATREGLTIKFRIDGLLLPVGELRTRDGRAQAEQVVSRIKVLADLDIAETRIPQDGRFKVLLGRQGELPVDFRVSVMPSLHGEDVVLRLLDKRRLATATGSLSLAVLGYDEVLAQTLRGLAGRPHGMLLITGPTGSGKTTTLYALLMETARASEKTVAIEDPVEYQLPGVLQIPVNEKKGLTFARGLRSILRHDPDRIMVGEIRDPETADIAVQAALTGHLVLSSLHANGVFEVIQRFTHLGVDRYALATCLNGIVAQRLVRLNCRQCRAAETVSAAQWVGLGLADDVALPPQRGVGCPACRGSGFAGRRAIAQYLILDDGLREAIIAQAPLRQLKLLASECGRIDWLAAVDPLLRHGDISFAEAQRALAN
ncbi:MAG TPA: GspE/PulE family protein [Accumulibacter sp.]|nr:GspE/PulE family protein [Accumulibacter sp.]